jgi:hypothetical protein
VHLRNEKYKIKIESKDIIRGKIINILKQIYYKYIRHYQSFFVLDYLNHLISIFPEISKEIMTN